ncbi:hypothetical protein FFZ77_08850 [Streptomyces katsurahamanus]|uniref:Uncharacterized protein n=2 Tax=Streptomyces TaxID=1883 RepID=A0A646KCM5_STRJU|nr:hypothetical protein [Streptomyces katsurahamanus]MQS99850.1 hypothetical protein [Streptomyces jumonjinensis]
MNGASPRRGSGAFRVTQEGAGLAFPPLVGAGCVTRREGLIQTLVRGLSEGPGSIGFDLTPHRQVETRE